MQIRTRSQRKTASGTPAVVAAEAAPQSPAKRARRGKHAGEAAVEPSSDSAPAAAPAAEPASPPKQRTRPIAASTPSRSEKRHGLLEAAAVGAAAAAASAAVTAAAAAADADAPNTPRTPRTPHRAQTPRTPRTPASVYLEAKSVFHRCATPSRLVGRDAERRAIRRFIEIHALEGVPGSLYISGYPGTGKTALLDEVCRNMAAEMKSAARKVTLVKLNCMNFTQAGSIFAGLLQAATGETVPAKSGLKSLEQVIMPGSKCSGDKEAGNSFFLFILDELDQLISRDQEALYQLFTWARAPHGRMALIGISNAMDLTTRFLPRLRAKDCEPQLLNFDVYKVTEIAAIIKDRLLMIGAGDGGDMHEVDGHVPSTPSRKRTHDEISGPEIAAPAAPGGVGDHRVGLTLIQPMAIEMAARKIVDTGDVRKALDVCRHAIEMAEAEERQRVASLSALTPRKPPSLAAALAAAAAEPGSPKSGSDATTSVAAHPAALSAAPVVCKVTMKHVLQATSAIFGSPNANRIKALNMHHKLVLCALVVMKQHAVADFTVAKVYEVYLALAKNGSMVAPVHRTEFNDLVMTLETQGLVHLHSRRKVDDLANKTASLIVRASDVEQAVSSVPVLATLLKDAKTVLQNAKIV